MGDIVIKPVMSELEEQFAKTQADEAAKGDSMIALQYRRFLVGALCTVCGEPLGEPDHNEAWIIQNDEGETLHAHCENLEA